MAANWDDDAETQQGSWRIRRIVRIFYKNRYSHLPIIDWKDFVKERKAHNVEINGIVISDMDEEKFIDEFITWVESINGKFFGITKDVEENN